MHAKLYGALAGAIIFVSFLAPPEARAADGPGGGPIGIDQRSFDLGSISVFAEIVDMGLKRLALSPAVPAAAMDALIEDAQRIATAANVQIYREPEFLVTDLFPPGATAGKHVLLLYQGSTLAEYLALKARKAELEASGNYTAETRGEIARALGALLSYPERHIERLLARSRGAAP